jgi:hypothetical protein
MTAKRNKRRPMVAASDIVDRVSEADRVWFEQHPGVPVYERPAVKGEFGDNIFPRGAIVTVFQVRPGVRIRRVLE